MRHTKLVKTWLEIVATNYQRPTEAVRLYDCTIMTNQDRPYDGVHAYVGNQ